MVEFDEGYFTVEASELEKNKGKRGRGAAGKQNVAITAESIPLEDIDTGKKSKYCRYYFKAKVLETHKKVNEFIYKLNRRYFGDKLFDRLVIASITGL